jgi:hypothetical protein
VRRPNKPVNRGHLHTIVCNVLRNQLCEENGSHPLVPYFCLGLCALAQRCAHPRPCLMLYPLCLFVGLRLQSLPRPWRVDLGTLIPQKPLVCPSLDQRSSCGAGMAVCPVLGMVATSAIPGNAVYLFTYSTGCGGGGGGSRGGGESGGGNSEDCGPARGNSEDGWGSWGSGGSSGSGDTSTGWSEGGVGSAGGGSGAGSRGGSGGGSEGGGGGGGRGDSASGPQPLGPQESVGAGVTRRAGRPPHTAAS